MNSQIGLKAHSHVSRILYMILIYDMIYIYIYAHFQNRLYSFPSKCYSRTFCKNTGGPWVSVCQFHTLARKPPVDDNGVIFLSYISISCHQGAV